MKSSVRYLSCVLVALIVVLPACGDDESPTQPPALMLPAEDMIGTYELLDFREWGYVTSFGTGGGGWGDQGIRTDFSSTPASYETHSGEMVILGDETGQAFAQVFVQDGDSVRTAAGMVNLTYTSGTEEGEFMALQGFGGYMIVFTCTGLELRFDHATHGVSVPGAGGEVTRWEIWKKVSDEAVPLF